jgi:sporulation protein YlmC with PRC-barrel domain
MMKRFLATAAIVALTAGYAHAANDATLNTNAAASTTTSGELMFLPSASADMHLASRLIGEPVYNGTSDDAEQIGEVSDLVLAADGSIDAAIIGVGGFLGVGEKSVAIDFENLSWTVASDQTDRLILAATSEQLEAAPAFDVSVFDDTNAAMTDTAMAPGAADGTILDPAAPQIDTDTAMGSDVTEDGAIVAPVPGDQVAAVPSNLTDVDVTTISANDLISTAVYAGNEENVGEVGDVLLNEDGTIDAVVLDVGGFLGIGQKPVVISFDALTIRKDADGTLFVYTAFTREQLESAPNYDATTYPDSRDSMLLRNVG